MVRHDPRHLDLAGELADVPVDLTARERLEFEVSQLVDGTLAVERRPAVEAAVAGDAALRALFEALAGLDALLSRRPDLARADVDGIAGRVMAVVHADADAGPLVELKPAGRARAVARAVTRGGIRGWSYTLTAVAAALVVGVGLGILATRPNPAAPGVLVVAPLAVPAGRADATMEVLGPAALLAQGYPGGIPGDLIALSVIGPDVQSVLDPGDSTSELADTAGVFGAAPAVESPSRSLVASAQNDTVAE